MVSAALRVCRNLFYYNKVYQVFEEMANSPSERRIDLANFKIGAEKMGLARDDAQAEVGPACRCLYVFVALSSCVFQYFSVISTQWYLLLTGCSQEEFNEIVGEGGREILFDQFCHYVMHAHFPGVADIDDELATGATGDLAIQN